MPTPELLAEGHDICLKVAPELEAAPLYIINHPAGLLAPVSSVGYAVHGDTSPQLRAALEKSGEWQGHGPTVVIVEQDLSRDQFFTLLQHELAHILPHKAIAEPTAASATDSSVAYAAFIATPPETEASREYPGWFPDHPMSFTRLALHCWWRFAMQGIVTDFTSLCAGQMYSQSPCFFYWRALGNEAVVMKDATFTEIMASAPPADFREAFRADLAHWMRNHPQQTSKVLERFK